MYIRLCHQVFWIRLDVPWKFSSTIQHAYKEGTPKKKVKINKNKKLSQKKNEVGKNGKNPNFHV